MAKVFSWKIDDSLYGYLAPINTGDSRITTTRIDSPEILSAVVDAVKGYNRDSAKTAFDLMAVEALTKYGKTIVWDDAYWDTSLSGTSAIILTGKDGEGCGTGSGSGGGSGSISVTDPAFQQLEDYINACLAEAEKRIKQSNEEVKQYLSDSTSKSIQEAEKALAEAKASIQALEAEAIKSLSAATEAVDGARSLFSGGTITPESIKNVMDKTQVVTDWMNDNSLSLCGMTFDYDLANEIIAGRYTGMTVGAFSEMATGINAVSGTVGSVRLDVDYCKGKVDITASYVDSLSGKVIDVQREMSAIDAKIADVVKYADLQSAVTTEVKREMVGAEARITDAVTAKTTSAITIVSQNLNALSGFVETKLVREFSGSVTQIEDKLDVVSGMSIRAITKADDAMASAATLRDEWNVASGMIRSVADLVAKSDADGIVYREMTGATQSPTTDPRVYRKDADGKYYRDKAYTILVPDQTKVYVEYSVQMASYIKQTSSSITMSVINDKDQMGAAIDMCLSADGSSSMALIANKITMSGDTIIGGGLSAKTANIGGIIMGKGQLYSSKAIGSSPAFMLDGNTGGLTAQSADIKGKITAESGTIGGIVVDNNSIRSDNGNFSVDNTGLLVAKNAQINGGLTAQTSDGKKTSIMDANTFKISQTDGSSVSSISIEILPEWSGRTNVPALVMEFGGQRYVLDPGSWKKEGSAGGTYATIQQLTYNTAYTGYSIDAIKTEIQKISGTGAVFDSDIQAAKKYCKNLTETGKLWLIVGASATPPADLAPFIGKVVDVKPLNVTYIDDTNVAEAVTKMTGHLANVHYLRSQHAYTTSYVFWSGNTFYRPGYIEFNVSNIGNITTIEENCAYCYEIINGDSNIKFYYSWAKATVRNETDNWKNNNYYGTRYAENLDDLGSVFNTIGWGYMGD